MYPVPQSLLLHRVRNNCDCAEGKNVTIEDAYFIQYSCHNFRSFLKMMLMKTLVSLIITEIMQCAFYNNNEVLYNISF
jgi:hypothetical protein